MRVLAVMPAVLEREVSEKLKVECLSEHCLNYRHVDSCSLPRKIDEHKRAEEQDAKYKECAVSNHKS